jgi:ABC-type phosphate/phosphonate transport system substrate-binding protein
MTTAIMNARMYSVTPEVEALWRELLAHVTDEAGVPLHYVAYPAPQPLEDLWSRPDLGCVLMCGYPVALQLAAVLPIAAPVPAAPWAAGRPLYRSNLIVRADSPYNTLEDTFGGRAAWTVEHSHSGFNAFRHHLLSYRTPQRPQLYREMVPNLVTARAILDAVREGRIDVGPLDAYWHLLVAKHAPALVEGVRVLEATDTATLPAFVAAASTPAATVDALRTAFVGAVRQPWFAELADALLIDGFAAVDAADYARTLEWDQQARAEGYPRPA